MDAKTSKIWSLTNFIPRLVAHFSNKGVKYYKIHILLSRKCTVWHWCWYCPKKCTKMCSKRRRRGRLQTSKHGCLHWVFYEEREKKHSFVRRQGYTQSILVSDTEYKHDFVDKKAPRGSAAVWTGCGRRLTHSARVIQSELESNGARSPRRNKFHH